MLRTTHPTLHTFIKGDPHEVRHLLIAGDDAGANTLSQIVDRVHSGIATGTQYEMQKREGELMQEWSVEGFRKKEKAFEPWSRALTLPTAMGYHALFDPQPRNPVNRVLLTRWAGRTAKNGGEYLYAFDRNQLTAKPKMPSMTLGTTPAEFRQTLVGASKISDSLGPDDQVRSCGLTIRKALPVSGLS
jgi:hypothetical protein